MGGYSLQGSSNENQGNHSDEDGDGVVMKRGARSYKHENVIKWRPRWPQQWKGGGGGGGSYLQGSYNKYQGAHNDE